MERKYRKLDNILKDRLSYLQYLCVVHHGMPDFFCERYGKMKFVECKFGYEQLSDTQVRCILTLKRLGFAVEVHKLVFAPTKTRKAYVDIVEGEKIIREKQMKLQKY